MPNFTCINRKSAGTLSPIESATVSPGTNSLARKLCTFPPRKLKTQKKIK